mgnify:CR=1 FL=1
MLDMKFIIEHAKSLKDTLKKRYLADKIWMVDELVNDHQFWKKLKFENDNLRHERNKISKDINQLRKGKKDASKEIKRAKQIPMKIKDNEEQMGLLAEKIKEKIKQMPNILQSGVPKGKDESKNPEIRTWGKTPKFSFPVKNHAELVEGLGIADFDAGRIAAGKGFNYVKNELAWLDVALRRYGIDFLMGKGFEFVIPPMMLNRKSLGGAVNLTDFEDVIYKVENEDLYLIGTAEHALIAMMQNKTLKKKDLPLRTCAFTPCFRKEIGSSGVDTKGLFRMHQFNKVEQVVFCEPEQSDKILEELQKISEKFFQSLKIPYRVVEICSGDLGPKLAKQYDIEAWFPRQKAYREVTSAGNCTDYQARTLNIQYEDKGEKKYVHILNNTMVATSRAMVAILEHYQQKDGSIKVPTVLQKYTGFKVIKKK